MGAFRAQQRICFYYSAKSAKASFATKHEPYLLDKFAPFFRGDTTRFMFRYVDDVVLCDGFIKSLLFLGDFIALTSHFIGIPAVVTNELEAFVGNV